MEKHAAESRAWYVKQYELNDSQHTDCSACRVQQGMKEDAEKNKARST